MAGATIRDVRKAVKAAGAMMTFDGTSEGRRYNVDAPDGQLWTEGAVHALVFETFSYETADDRERTYADVLDRMALGLEPCLLPYCCSEEEEDA